MRAYRAATLTKLHEGMTRSLVHASAEELDMVTTVDVQIHDVIGVAESMAWEFDLKSMWLTPSRWTMMCNQYLDPEELKAWLHACGAKIGTRGRGIAVMRTRVVKPRGGAATGHTNKETRRWGSCMLAVSYKALPKPTLTLHSRTSYLGYIGALDLSVAWMCARYLAKELGITVEDIRFVWHIESIQWHNFKSLAWMLNHTDPEKRRLYRRLMLLSTKKLTDEELAMLSASPAMRLSRKWLTKLRREDQNGLTYGDMTYNTYRRIRRRFHTEVLGYEKAKQFEGWSYYKKGDKVGQEKEFFPAYKPLPSTPVEKLDFGRLGLPLAGVEQIEYHGGEGEFDDEEDE